MIIPIETIFNSVESTFAVHVDTNHRISIVVDSIRVALVDATRSGVDLKNGKPVTVYMEYDKYQIKIWVGQIKSGMPLLAAQVDLSNRFRGFGYVAVSAAGCAIKSINRWEFGRLTDDEQGSCIVCFRDSSDELRIGSTVQDIPIQVIIQKYLVAFLILLTLITGYLKRGGGVRLRKVQLRPRTRR
ncbi:hypothetical protein L2E82_52412 [Cichorium intybus]|nr:hypothetical protein L2E82_52412 [Cichorium intybus]